MVVGRHLPVGRFILEGPARGGRTTDGAGRRDRRTRECPGAGEGGCGGGAPWARGQRGGMRSPLGLFGLDGKSRVGNLIDVGEQPFEPKGADFLLWGLVSLGHGRGDSSVSCPGLQTTKPRQITRIHLLQSGSGAEREDQSWPGDSKSRPSPPAANSPHARVCLPIDQVRAAGGRVTCHGSGLGRGGDECRQKTQAK